MKGENKHIDRLTEELMTRYMNGDLSDREMHAVERLLLDSDFEAEAMEGAASVTTGEWQSDMKDLHIRLGKRLVPANKSRLWMWAVAASVILLVSFGIFFFNSPLNDQLAMEESTEALDKRENSTKAGEERPSVAMDESAPVRESQPEDTAGEASRLALAQESETDVNQENKAIEPGEALVQTQSEAEATTDEAIDADMAADVAVYKELNTLPRLAADSAPQGALTQADIRARAAEQELVGVIKGEELELISPMAGNPSRRLEQFHGKVLDPRGQPVPNASVLVPAANKAVVTNPEGEFDLALDDLQGDETIISEVGLKSKKLVVPSSDSVTIILEDGEEDLGEVVVSKGDAPSRNIIYRGAGPQGGLARFDEYLEANLKHPENDSVQAEVTLIFTVNPDGSLGDIKVRRSPGKAYDAEAIRLLTEGPRWLPALQDGSPVRDRVRVRIRFGE